MSNDTQSPGPNAPHNAQLEVHAGWVRTGQDGTPGQKAYYINLEAKPGNGDKVEQFLRDILAGMSRNQVLALRFAPDSPTRLLESLKRFPTLQHETRMMSAPEAKTSSVPQNWKKCWPIPRTSIDSMSCSESSAPCLERRLLESNAVNCRSPKFSRSSS